MGDAVMSDAVISEASAPAARQAVTFGLVGVLPRIKFLSTWLARAYAVCAVLALAAVWLHRYPAGTDLPQHANLFQILANYGDPHSGYRFFYDIDFFTPYALLYLLAWPLTKIGGGLFAVKALLSLTVLATPWALEKWLRSVGGERSLGILGFVLVFGFGYQWGFLSFVLATPISFLYLASVEEMRKARTARRLLTSAGFAVLLFFCHGVTFGLVMLASGLACLMQRRLRNIVFDLGHFVPAIAVLVPWYLHHPSDAASGFSAWPTTDRIVSLFSGLFSKTPSYPASLAAFSAALVLFAAGRPALSLRPARVLPFALALVGLFSIPDWVGATWLVGTRFAQFVHCYSLGAFDFRADERGRRQLQRVAFGVVVAVLLSVNYRLYVFNQELAGLDQVKTQIPGGSDVKLYLGDSDSEVFGEAALGQAAAWITAERGGFLENDAARYFQIPVQRRGIIPWPTQYPYLVARGTLRQARSAVGPEAQIVSSAGHFHVFEAKVIRLDLPGMKFVRYAQSWGKPARDMSVDGDPLSVGGRHYETGIGAHARSILEMRPRAGVHRIRGAVGMDDGAGAPVKAVFRIMDSRRRDLWASRKLSKGDAAESFDVSLKGLDGDLFLVTEPVADSINNAHTDWLDVTAVP
jgi:hypothetical protein